MTPARSGDPLQGQTVKTAVAIVAFSISSLACAILPPVYQVPRSFSVHVANMNGPVAGLKLRVTRFNNKKLNQLSIEQQRTAVPDQFVELIAETTTDSQGVAHFNLSKSGQFDLESDSPGSSLWIEVNVERGARSKTLELQWPTTQILASTQARGRITSGLFSSKSGPVKGAVLSLHTFLPFTEVASTTTNDDGSFAFGDVLPGLYFLHLTIKGLNSPLVSDPLEGDIPIRIGPQSPRESLSIATDYSDCGLSYDLEENKAKHKPTACFKGGAPIPCVY
jgi:hypothetical protein